MSARFLMIAECTARSRWWSTSLDWLQSFHNPSMQSPAKAQPIPSQTAETRSRHLPRVASSATCHVVCHVSRRLPHCGGRALLLLAIQVCRTLR